MLTDEQLNTLECFARKVTPGMWLFDGMHCEKLSYINAATPPVILEMIEELRQARKMRDIFGRDKYLKVMISQPMRGKSKEEILSVREKFKRFIEASGHTFIDAYDESFQEMEGKNVALRSLAKSLEHMAECDAVLFCKGWRDARGCCMEFHAAKAYGIEIVEEV